MVELNEGEVDAAGQGVKSDIEAFLKLKVESVRVRRAFTIDGGFTESQMDALKRELFVTKITERAVEEGKDGFDWLIDVGFKPGVTDNVGNTTKNAGIPDVLARTHAGEDVPEVGGVYTSKQYLIKGDLTRKEVERIGTGLLANDTVESVTVLDYNNIMKAGIPLNLPIVIGEPDIRINSYDLDVSDEELVRISMEGLLSLSLHEMNVIAEYFQRPDVIEERKTIGMAQEFWDKPTDAEMEVLAQTWSEHCKHKIFNAKIKYIDATAAETALIDSMFDTFIKGPSNRIAKKFGWVVSSFHDNAGIIKFNDRIYVADKIETHNSPSVLDPFGGAMTGIVGVNRDIIGAGIGAKPMFNIFHYCLGSPSYNGTVYQNTLHPRRSRNGIHSGVIAGGNQSGIPLMYGDETFDQDYYPRVLVLCGTIGVMPAEINGRPSEFKKADDGDAIVMVGGRVGKDGIHGATFSSAELDKESPTQPVQIGDPITQKKMTDFLIEARNLGLYKNITDNGAGGLSSSVGEMARSSGGCNFDLASVPLKYHGLQPWEILVSEAQERMTVAVPRENIKEFLDLAEAMDVEATALGYFKDSGRFHVEYNGKHGNDIVAHLDMDFLHNGVPRMGLEASWECPVFEDPDFGQPEDMDFVFEQMLSRLNICSKEEKIRQYDHEVKGLSVVKPFVGQDRDVPSDATIAFLEHGSKEGLIVSAGIKPQYSFIDTYHMTASVIDEAIRRIIAVGGRLPDESTPVYGLDNFCWNMSDLYSEDGKRKLAQLVRANMALRNYCEAFEVPCISGKDSMKNVWKEGDEEMPIPPTLLFSARGKMHDVSKAVTMDAKLAGDLVYVVGTTYDELGASEYYAYVGERERGQRYIGNSVPTVDAERAKAIYNRMSEATDKEIVHSIHTPTIGGLGIAFAKSAFAGNLGMEIDLGKVPYEGDGRDDSRLFSQSNSRFVVTVAPEYKEEFEKAMDGSAYSQVGVVTDDSRLKIKGSSGNYIVDSDLGHLKEAWKSTLG